MSAKYRPQRFSEVVAQPHVVRTLGNAVQYGRLAQAYLLSGPRGTGKTTLARLLAKALNCLQREGCEPCNSCPSCLDITQGHSLDVLEIDGASHRGIDDIRKISETVGYAASAGGYKIYIIDEVHMLTKEAFNALLKTLEEPPRKVLFCLATTEPQKVPATIVSRCQRFQLNRIPVLLVVEKLRRLIGDRQVDEEALLLIARRADGALRDAEMLFDQLLAFHEGPLKAHVVRDALGLMEQDILFELDLAGKEGHLAKAFEVAEQLFSKGHDPHHFIEMLTDHMRTLLLFLLGSDQTAKLELTETERRQYALSATYYHPPQCLDLLEYLVPMQEKIRLMPCPRTALEMILLHLLRSHQRIPLDLLLEKLSDLERQVSGQEEEIAAPTPLPKNEALPQPSMPHADELPHAPEPAKEPAEKNTATFPKSHYDTVMHFAAVELGGILQKKNSTSK